MTQLRKTTVSLTLVIEHEVGKNVDPWLLDRSHLYEAVVQRLFEAEVLEPRAGGGVKPFRVLRYETITSSEAIEETLKP